MSDDKFFMDTSFVQALLDKNDQWHKSAKALSSQVLLAKEIWLHDGIIIEIAGAFSKMDEYLKKNAIDFIDELYKTLNVQIVHLEQELLIRGIIMIIENILIKSGV
jgi:predicted nucleic acid-binding protein